MKINLRRSNDFLAATFAVMLLLLGSQSSPAQSNTFPSSGNAGAGGTAPLTPLEVYAPVTSTFTGNARGALSIGVSGSPTNLYYRAIDFLYNDSYGPAARIGMKYDNNLGSFLYFGTSNSTLGGITNSALVIDPNGNVGVGTASPTLPLEIRGNAIAFDDGRALVGSYDLSTTGQGVGGGIQFGGKYDNNGALAGFASISGIKENATNGNYSSALVFTTRTSGGNQTEKLRITSMGNVGIGTMSPTSILSAIHGNR